MLTKYTKYKAAGPACISVVAFFLAACNFNDSIVYSGDFGVGEVLQAYAGEYLLTGMGLKLSCEVVDGRLKMSMEGQPDVYLDPLSETEFAYEGVEASIEFKINDRGDKAVRHQGGRLQGRYLFYRRAGLSARWGRTGDRLYGSQRPHPGHRVREAVATADSVSWF